MNTSMEHSKSHSLIFWLVFTLIISSLTVVGSVAPAYAGIPTIISAKITGSNTITVVYSEPVITLQVEYSDLQLTAGGPRNVIALLGSGTDTITLTFDGAAAVVDETATIDIVGPISVSTGQPLAVQNDLAVTDGQIPTATNQPTAAAGPIIDVAEWTAGFDVVAPLGTSNAVAGDTLELLLGGASFPVSLTRVLTAGDIASGDFTFTIASGQLGADGLKSITSKVTDVAGNVGPAGPTLVLTLDTGGVAGGPPTKTTSRELISSYFSKLTPSQISFVQDKEITLKGTRTSFDNKMETMSVLVDKPLELKIQFLDAPGVSYLQKIQLFFNLRDSKFKMQDSNTFIVYDKYAKFFVNDPEGFFSDINYDIVYQNGFTEFTFYITFAKPMEKSHLIIQYIDWVHNSRMLNIRNALEVVSEGKISSDISSQNEIKETAETTLELNRYDYVISENEQNEIITPNLGLLTEKQQSNEINNMKWFEYMRASESILQDNRFKEEKREYKIPSGIKEATYWWANESHLKDDQFFKGIKYLINKKIISLPEKNLENIDNPESIPLWIKQDTGWWDDVGKITDEYFIETIEKLIRAQMIEIHDLK